jgi:predicted CXXCH cytochrome family protein
VTCHGDFRGTGGNGINEHSFHVSAATGTCGTCHWAPDSRNSPYLYKATSGTTTDSEGCVGCHGTDYGDSRADQPNWMRSPGLRDQHEARNPGLCRNGACHASNEPTPNPESTVPPYYLRADVNVKDPCNGDVVANGGEDLGLGGAGGLDNDGDGTRDAADPDCSGGNPTPGEVTQLLVTAYDEASGAISLTYGTPTCEAPEHAINYGPLNPADLAAYNWTGQDCDIGSSGSYSSFNPGSGAFFFVVVANDTVEFEGSYGTDDTGSERPPYATAPTCPLTQDLAARCD